MHVRTLAFLCCAALTSGCDNPSTNPPPLDFGGGGDGFSFGGDGGGGSDGGDGGSTVNPDAGPDTTGPTIVIMKPMAGAFIGGLTTVVATITDPSGINDKTVQAVFTGNLMYSVNLVNTGMDQYEGVFDASVLGTSFVFPSLSVRADDKLGNHADVGEELIADNVPPVIALDPPKMQVARKDAMTGAIICSAPFDPVGDESANDGQTVQQIVSLKARVADSGNSAPGLLVPYISFVDPNSAKVVLIPTANTPLVVDSDGDGMCDEINPLLIPVAGAITASDQSIEINLSALQAGGTPDYFSVQSTTGNTPCTRTGDPTATAAPDLLCKLSGTTLTYVLMNGTDPTPEIFSIPPVIKNDYQCIGLQFDAKNRLGTGKVCAAVTARDNAGNVGVSAPLHLCIDDGAGGCNGYTFNASDCTGKFDKASKTVVAGTCTPKTFKVSNEVDLLP